jgi:GT2 family glycosyltransferase
MPKRISLGICVIFFNRVDQTIACIDSFSTAGAPVYVHNNGSSDGATTRLVEHIAGRTDVTFLDGKENLGAGGGRNKLIGASQEDWLLFVDNDITAKSPNWHHNLCRHVSHSKDVDVFVPKIHNVWNDTWVRPARLRIEDARAVYEDPESDFTNLFPGGGSLVARSVFDRIGLFDPGLMAFEDFELALRALRAGQDLVVRSIDDVTLLHHRRFAESADDRYAALTRYDVGKISEAHEKILRVHGVALDPDFRPWVEDQLRELTVRPAPPADSAQHQTEEQGAPPQSQEHSTQHPSNGQGLIGALLSWTRRSS